MRTGLCDFDPESEFDQERFDKAVAEYRAEKAKKGKKAYIVAQLMKKLDDLCDEITKVQSTSKP